MLTDPTRCSRRRGRELCRGQLTAAKTTPASDAAVTAQNRINQILEGELRPGLAGVELDPPLYLRDLLTLCTLLDRHAQPRTGTAQTGQPGRLHDHPAALVTVLPDALALADLPDRGALSDALRELAEHRYRADGKTLLVSKAGPMSEHLAAIIRTAVNGSTWATASLRMGLDPRAHRRPDDLDDRLEPRHVPQLFWREDYDREISMLFEFDDFTHWLGRRFCSVLLARMLTPLDWLGAVRYLDLPETQRFVNEGYNTTFAKLRSHQRFDELARRVKHIANQHAATELIDFKRRRAQLADWDGVDVDCWHLLPPRPRPISPFFRKDNPGRRRCASLWLWSQLTSGDERAGRASIRTTKLHEQTHFAASTLAPLRERLLILGELLIETPTAARSTLHNRLAATLHHRGHLAEKFYLDTIDPMITERVLAHVASHTGLDIPSLTTPSVGSHAPPAVTHSRLLATRLLRATACVSYTAIGAAIGGDGNYLAGADHSYCDKLKTEPRLATEADRLALAIEHWHTAAPSPPRTPHHQRMRDLALAIKDRCADVLQASNGEHAARLTSVSLCRHHTDLTCPELAEAQPTFAHATVARHRRADSEFNPRYRRLASDARQLQRDAGYVNANLTRGLTSTSPDARPRLNSGVRN